jgi:DUF4097 and DUF4098 domain-containing protein YvlB
MDTKPEKRIVRIGRALRGGVLFLLSLPLLASPVAFQDNIYIKSHRGDYQKTNTKGGFVIDSIVGNCVVDSTGGSLQFGRIQGNLTGTTRGGDIRVAQVEGNARLCTQAGNILIQKAKGKVSAEAGLGEIVIEQAGSVTAKTINGGDIKIRGVSGFVEAQAKGNVTFITDGSYEGDVLCDLAAGEGDIMLYIPEGLGVSLVIKTPVFMDSSRETRIRSDFNFAEFKQTYVTEQTLILSSNINNGGKKIHLTIDKGDVYILKVRPKRAIRRS